MNIKENLMQEIAGRVGYSIDLRDIFENYIITKGSKYKRSNLKMRVEQFIVAKQIEGLSEKTLQNYRQQLEMFANRIKKSVNQISSDDIREYVFYLTNERKVKQRSLETYMAYLKTFFSWLVTEEVIKRDPMKKIHSGKLDKSTSRRSLKAEDQEKIRECCRDIREKSIVEFLISTGCRLSETININVSDVNFDERSVIVTGKGNKRRKVYFSIRCNLYLQQYLATRRFESEALFASRKRPYGRLQKRSFQKIIRQLGELSGLPFNLHPHLFRHTFATNCINIGMDIVTIQRLLGHSNLQTTQIYTHMSEENIKNEYRKLMG